MAVDPFGALIGLAGLASSSQSSGMATALQWMNLQFQKQQAEKQFRLATAARTDPYGNEQRYNELLNRWENILTPTQNQILKSGEHEQLLSLTEDAQRNRNIKRQQVARGAEAAKDYERALVGYRYDQPKGDRAIRDELTSLMNPNIEAGMKSGQASSIRQALRTGAGALIPQIIKSTDDSVGEAVGKNALAIRNAAVGEAANRVQQHDARYLPELSKFEQIMDMGDGMPQKFSTLPESMTAQQGQSQQQMLAALAAGAGEVGGAYQGLAAAAGKGPDFKGLASYFNDGVGRTSTARRKGYNLTPMATPAADGGSSVGTRVPDEDEKERTDWLTTGNW